MSEGGEFIEETRKSGNWDMGYIRSNSGVCVVLEEEIRFYFTGFAGDKSRAQTQDPCTGGMYANGAMGFATLRRDGFCSLSGGVVVTKPIMFTKGDRLWINVNAKGGVLSVVAEGLDGNCLGSCQIQEEDSVKREVFELPTGTPFRLKFSIRGRAKLYSFWTADASGKSGGYLGGGSPESSTLRDVQ